MNRMITLLCAVFFTFLAAAPLVAEEKEDTLNDLKQEIQDLREQTETQRKAYETQLKEMQKRLEALTPSSAESELELEIAKEAATATSAEAKGGLWSSLGKGLQSLNPDISVIMDTNYYNEDADEPVSELAGEIPGFGHAHSHGHEHGHSHGAFEEGFNLREVELYLSAEVDPYVKGYTTLAFHEEGSEVEEAVFQTTCLPAGFQVLGGKFLSHFGRINSQHPHEWDFVDRPLVYDLSLGDHGLLEKGVQLSWLAPTSTHLLLGVEALQGENEKMFNHIGGHELPDEDGPRLWVGWAKFSPNLPQKHGLQLGVFGGYGDHQEAHDGNEDEVMDHWLDGENYFLGGDVVYKHDSGHEHGQGDFTVQAEYFWRKKDLEVKQHELVPNFEGRPREDEQDGYYLQALYGFFPRWRAGLRWEQVGLVNESEFPTGATEDFDESYRLSGMLDFSPSEFSRIRLQVNRGEFALEEGDEDYWQFWVQCVISLGTHGAHKF